MQSIGRMGRIRLIRRTRRIGLMLFALAAGAWSLTWVETSQQDFSDGVLENNLYVSYRDGGAIEFTARFDLNGDGYLDLVCPDDSGPYLRIYFGSTAGYDSARSRYFSVTGGGGVEVADLDTDGYADLVHSGWRAQNVIIYWGTDSGPSPTDTTWLATGGQSEAVTVHDLDRDSYLDIIAARDSGGVLVFWGSLSGYSGADTSVILLNGRVGHDLGVADLDQDGWADIVAVRWNRDSNAVIYWGPGRQPRELAWLPIPDGKPHGTTIADFNRDGWLDVVGNVYADGLSAYVFYGSDSGFSESRREVVHPGQCYGGSSASYWDADTTLDLVFFRGDFDTTVSLTPQVFFNDLGSTVHFSDGNQADIGVRGFNASGGMVGDLDRDGYLDMFVQGYNEGEPSFVLWGPSWTSFDSLPASRSHHGAAREAGNTYDRRFQERYVSSVFGAGDTAFWHRVSWSDTTPGGSEVGMELRTGDSPLPGPDWTDWQSFANGETIPFRFASLYIQYRATLRYQTPAQLPMLFSVQIDYGPVPEIDVAPTVILAPTGNLDSGTSVTPRAVVRNFGNQPAEFPVTML
ncbi:VCBS repeat-containing protein, partial [candidate division WOR-3 bacterium]|nr:VCBS repeat-containing protein [candidate division WOR-3 bacterium]